MTNAPSTPQQWEEVHYEWRMLLWLDRRLGTHPPLSSGSQLAMCERSIDRNAWLEAFLVHARCLIEFLGWRGGPQDDDLRSPMEVPKDERLAKMVIEVHKRLAHLTTLRGEKLEWSHTAITMNLSSAMARVCRDHTTPIALECHGLHGRLQEALTSSGVRDVIMSMPLTSPVQ